MIRVVNDALGPVKVTAPRSDTVVNVRGRLFKRNKQSQVIPHVAWPSSMTSAPAISRAHGIIMIIKFFNPEISSPQNYEWEWN